MKLFLRREKDRIWYWDTETLLTFCEPLAIHQEKKWVIGITDDDLNVDWKGRRK